MLFDTYFDSRSYHFEERGNDVEQPRNISKDPLHVPKGKGIERGIECKVVKNAFLTRHKIYNINSDRKLKS